MNDNTSKKSEKNTSSAYAKLNKLNIAPRKVRLVADLIRNKPLKQAYATLTFEKKQASVNLKKLLLSAENNWKSKQDDKSENKELYIQEIYVNGAGMMKRIKPAPQGRAHTIRKRSSHVTVVVGQENPKQASIKKNK